MKGAIAYRFETPVYPGNILYVNVVEKYHCTNNCRFCSRPRDGIPGQKNIYEEKAGVNLYLPEAPTIDKVMRNIRKNIREDDKELAIIGLGEPLHQFDLILKIIEKTKAKYDIKTRVDTNGFTFGIGRDVESLVKAGLDEIRISLNAINKEEYNALCRPIYSIMFNPFLTEFIQDCNKSSIDTFVSFVVNFRDEETGISTRTREEYIAFAKTLGLDEKQVIIREFVPQI